VSRRSQIAQVLALVLILGLVLFASAGRLDVLQFWLYLAVFLGGGITGLFLIDPDLWQERMRPGGGPGMHRRAVTWFSLPLLLAHLGFAGADVGRLHVSDGVPAWVRAAGLLGLVVTFAVELWAMHVNRFFSSVIRIQRDRGQYVVQSGPYRVVRHPGYAAGILLSLSSGLALGSWGATALCLFAVPALVWRTVREDRQLQRELPGYAEYAAKVRYRLVPLVW